MIIKFDIDHEEWENKVQKFCGAVYGKHCLYPDATDSRCYSATCPMIKNILNYVLKKD